jgi:hypothetical protein
LVAKTKLKRCRADHRFVRSLLWHITHRCIFQKAHREWVEAGSSGNIARRDDPWSESIVVGSEGFAEQVKNELGFRAQHRSVSVADGLYTLRRAGLPYGDHFCRENEALTSNNTVPWKAKLATTEASPDPTPTVTFVRQSNRLRQQVTDHRPGES